MIKELVSEYYKTFGEPVDKRGFIILTVSNGFEPNGRASETFEDYYVIILPYIQYYWRGTHSWHLGRLGLRQSFQASTIELAIKRCMIFLQEIREQNGETTIKYDARRDI